MLRSFLITALAVMAGAIAPLADGRADDAPLVYASNYPLYFFASEIAGDAVEVRLPEIKGDPAYWAPDGDQVAELQAADRILLNGAGYEGWLDFVSLREERLVNTTAGLADRLLLLEEAVVHQHGPEGEHSHAGNAFTTWLDPQMAALQAQAIAVALTELAPASEVAFNQRLKELEQRLQQLDRNLEATFATLGHRPVVFSHPVYQYLQARYGINGRSLHWEPEIAPSTRDWIDLQKLLIDHPAALMVWEGEPLADTRKKLADQGIDSVVFEPAGNHPEGGDYYEVMERNRRQLLKALEDR